LRDRGAFKFERIGIGNCEVSTPKKDAQRRVADSTEQETTLTTRVDEARARAEANFRKEERAKDGAKAMMEYEANIRLVREKTERLRALRLAKEAADRAPARAWYCGRQRNPSP
jgi:hypothetical protein